MPTVLQENVGLTRNLALILGGCIQTMFVVGSFFPAFFCDKYGRRMPMMVGSFALGICMMMVAILLSFKGTAIEQSTSSASVAFFFLVRLPILLTLLFSGRSFGASARKATVVAIVEHFV